jgi:hypothetical protein
MEQSRSKVGTTLFHLLFREISIVALQSNIMSIRSNFQLDAEAAANYGQARRSHTGSSC